MRLVAAALEVQVAVAAAAAAAAAAAVQQRAKPRYSPATAAPAIPNALKSHRQIEQHSKHAGKRSIRVRMRLPAHRRAAKNQPCGACSEATIAMKERH